MANTKGKDNQAALVNFIKSKADKYQVKGVSLDEIHIRIKLPEFFLEVWQYQEFGDENKRWKLLESKKINVWKLKS